MNGNSWMKTFTVRALFILETFSILLLRFLFFCFFHHNSPSDHQFDPINGFKKINKSNELSKNENIWVKFYWCMASLSERLKSLCSLGLRGKTIFSLDGISARNWYNKCSLELCLELHWPALPVGRSFFRLAKLQNGQGRGGSLILVYLPISWTTSLDF